jgi:hypothetical protein
MNRFLVSCLIGLSLLSNSSMANDSTATVAAGGVEYEKNNDISMDDELLQISMDNIRITYHFSNHTDKQIKATVAFPLSPSSPDAKTLWDEDYIAHKFIDENPKPGEQYTNNMNIKNWYEGRAFINFERTVDGHTMGYHYRVIARTPDGKDITETLRKHNIPLSAPYLSGVMEEGYLFHDKKMTKRLHDMKLLDKEDKPIWSTQTIYYWDQYFEPKKTHEITHSYRPHTGSQFIQGSNPKTLNEITFSRKGYKWEDYNPDAAQTAALLQLFKDKPQDHPYRFSEVQYILTTGANWKDPIKKFRLEVTPPDADSLVICKWPGEMKKTADGKYVVELTNFTPKEDLKILFVKLKTENGF